MPIVYDETKDSLYLKGEANGAAQKEKQVIINMIKANKYSLPEIAAIANTTVEYVLKVKEELENKK